MNKKAIFSWGMKRKKRIFFIMLIMFCISFGFSLYVYPRFVCGEGAFQSGQNGCFANFAGSLKVMTLNIAHGRGTGPNQVFLKKKTFIKNLDAIAEMLKKENPAVTAFQETDGPSVWSGKFNHVKYLAEKAGFPYYTRGEHVKGLGLSYGTAIISKIPLKEQNSAAFTPSSLTPPKGYVKATIQLPKQNNKKIKFI